MKLQDKTKQAIMEDVITSAFQKALRKDNYALMRENFGDLPDETLEKMCSGIRVERKP